MLAAKKATTKTAGEVETLGGMLEDIAEKEVSGPARDLAKETKEAKKDLSGISEILNVDISGGNPVDMMKKLGLDPYSVEGSAEQLDAIKEAIDILKGADPADLTPKVDQVGVQDNIDAIQTYIQSKLGGTTTANIEATADKNAADNAAGEIKQTIESQKPLITAEVDQSALDNAVASMQAEITNQFTGGEGGDGGSGGSGGQGGTGGDAYTDLSFITQILNNWTGLITAIRDRLPMTALA
jgi:hypothetical protein